GVLVAGHVGQHDAGLLRPLALLDVQVGPAQPGGADLDDHVKRPGDLRLVDLLDLQSLVVVVQPRSLHAATSSPYRTRSRSRQMPPLASSESEVSRAIRPKRTKSSTGVPSPVTNAGASSPAGMPSALRSSRQRSASGPDNSPSVAGGGPAA